MLDSGTPRDKIVAAALRLAETRGWRELSLGEIAGEAGIPLAELRREFQSKGQMLAAFSRAVDQAVLEKFATPSADAARDRLFDVLLTRFEAMQPYKPALRRIRADLGRSFGEALAQLRPALKSQYWMLAAAGINGEGGRGLVARAGPAGDLCARVPGLARRRRSGPRPHHGRARPALAARRGGAAGDCAAPGGLRGIRARDLRAEGEGGSAGAGSAGDARPARRAAAGIRLRGERHCQWLRPDSLSSRIRLRMRPR